MAFPKPAKTRDVLQEELLAEVQRTQKLYLKDPNNIAREQFMEALRRFNSLVLYGKLPE